MHDQNQPRHCSDLRPEWKILIPVMLVIFIVGIPTLLFPVESEVILTAAYRAFTAAMGSVYLWLTLICLLLAIYFACSKYGDIKFGAVDEKPEFGTISWVSMIFCSSVAGACLFWAIVEPQWNLLNPPQHVLPESPEAYEWSLAYLLLHWGPTAWCSYFLCALPIAFIFHIRNTPKLRISTTLENVIGDRKDGFIGRAIDVIFIIGILFCTCATMILSLPTVEAALVAVFGIQPSFTLEVYILIFCSLIAGVSLYLGLKKGIEMLSNLNVIIAIALVLYAAVLGPTSTIFDIFTNAVGKMFGNYLNMSLWTDPFSSGTFPQDWTIFYQLFWASYAPFMGLFIARISRGRTVREIICWGMVGTILGGYLIHGVFGSYTLHLQFSGTLDVLAILQTQGGPASMMAVLDTLPFGTAVMLVYCLFSAIFLATSINSSCYVVAASATREIHHTEDPHRYHRVFWVFLQALLAVGALAIGGIEIAKIYGSFAGALMIFPIVLLNISWFKILKTDGPSLLKYQVAKPDTKDLKPVYVEDVECLPSD